MLFDTVSFILSTLMKEQHKKTKFLSRNEKEQGFEAYKRYSLWNGMGISFLSINIVSLLAIRFDATNLELGYISSAFHLAGLILIFLPRLTQGIVVGKLFYLSWLARGLICTLYGGLLFIEGRSGMYLILIVFTLFALFRMVGATLTRPLQKTLIRSSEEGKVLVSINVRFSIAQLISQAVSFTLMSLGLVSDLYGLLILLALGVLLNSVAAWYITRVPSREKVSYDRGRNVITVAREVFLHRERRNTVLLHWTSLSVGVLFTFAVAYLRRVTGLPANMVFLYTAIGGLGAIAAGIVLKPFTDSIGSKPLLIVTQFSLAAIALLWAFLGAETPVGIFFGLSFLVFFLLRTRLILVGRMIIKTMPDRDRIGFSSLLNLGAAIIIPVISLAGGALADGYLANNWRVIGLVHAYSPTFLLTAVLSIMSAAICFKTHDSGALSLKETAAIFFSTKNIRAFLDAYLLEAAESTEEKETILLSLQQSDTEIATQGVNTLLRSPLPWEKERALKSLLSYPRQELIGELLDEACDQHSYNRQDAIISLGAYPTPETEQVLRMCTKDPSAAVVATAFKSLARINAPGIADDVQDYMNTHQLDARVYLDCFTALSRADETGMYLSKLFSYGSSLHFGHRHAQMVYLIAARRLHMRPALSDYFHLENSSTGSGFSRLIEDTGELVSFYDARKFLTNAYKQSNYADLSEWSEKKVTLVEAKGAHRHLKHCISTLDGKTAGREEALASIYFTYHITIAEI